MYCEHFGLREPPFSLTPDTSYFLNRAGYQDAMNVLLVALRSGEGFVKVTGEVGTGKTLLCRKLINTLNGEFVTAYIHNPYLSPEGLLEALAGELLLAVPDEADPNRLLSLLSGALLEHFGAGRRVVLCLDEVQAMPIRTLETLRLLTNLETEKRKLIQVVMFGQPELERQLAQPSVRQLRQRITFSYQLQPLNATGVRAYIGHRLHVGGYHGATLFSDAALRLLTAASRGIPRLINILCNKALMSAYGQGREQVGRRDVLLAVQDTEDARAEGGWSSRMPLVELPRRALTWAGLLAMFAAGMAWGG